MTTPDGIIHYDHGAIAAHTGDVIAAAGKLETQLDDLRRDVERRTAGWEGRSSEAYRFHQLQWDEAAAGLQRILRDLGRAASAGNEQMGDTDRRLSAGWGG